MFAQSFILYPPQGHLREGKCHLLLGNAMAASRCFQKVLELESDNSQAQQEVSDSRVNEAGCYGFSSHYFLYPTGLNVMFWVVMA